MPRNCPYRRIADRVDIEVGRTEHHRADDGHEIEDDDQRHRREQQDDRRAGFGFHDVHLERQVLRGSCCWLLVAGSR